MNPIIEKVAAEIGEIGCLGPVISGICASAAIRATLEHYASNVSDGMIMVGSEVIYDLVDHPCYPEDSTIVPVTPMAIASLKAMLTKAIAELDAQEN